MRTICSLCLAATALFVIAFSTQTIDAQERDPDRQDDQRQMDEPGERRGRGRRRGQRRRGGRRNSGDQNALTVGELAPDFSLKFLDGSSTTELSQFRGEKPVVLFFGSYT